MRQIDQAARGGTESPPSNAWQAPGVGEKKWTPGSTKGERIAGVRRSGNLFNKELELAKKEEVIHAYSCRYSATHCLWISTEYFPLCNNPGIDLCSAECWVSPLVIEDGVKTELFKFIPRADHPLMAHRDFGVSFAHDVSSVRSKMVSDIKFMAGAIFGLPGEFFLCGFNCFDEPYCHALVLSPNKKHTKFAPCLFPKPDNTEELRVLQDGSSSFESFEQLSLGNPQVSGTNASGPKCKAEIMGNEGSNTRIAGWWCYHG
ncbi:hypothetical protein J3R82DRAFT_6985 [Butyriboletus roseoflavus]|nr:hypothetical protein J3R82DRAFT_6985 [Butyriboletus roseoflavus]